MTHEEALNAIGFQQLRITELLKENAELNKQLEKLKFQLLSGDSPSNSEKKQLYIELRKDRKMTALKDENKKLKKLLRRFENN